MKTFYTTACRDEFRRCSSWFISATIDPPGPGGETQAAFEYAVTDLEAAMYGDRIIRCRKQQALRAMRQLVGDRRVRLLTIEGPVRRQG